jgi:uncharacterized protein with von Willebrand factor type A (vWA) domain
MTDAFTANLVHFVRYLRATGLGVKPQTATELAAAARAVGLANRTDVYHAFKAVTVVRPTEVPRFDEAFELFFGASRPKIIFSDESEGAIAAQEERSASLPLLAPSAADIADDELEEVSDIVGGSYAERLATKDFADLTATEKEEILRMIARMRWRPADVASRRWLPATRGPRPHLPRACGTRG